MLKARYGLVYSTGDMAGTGIASFIKRLVDGLEEAECRDARCVEAYYIPELDSVLAGFEEDIIYLEFLDELLDVDAYIFLSRHKSEAGRRSLTVHHTGNPTSRADHGGSPYTLSISYSHMSKTLLKLVNKKAASRSLLGEYDVTLEATHHGPTGLSKPLVFIEIGSSEAEWRDDRARLVLAESVVEALSNQPAEDYCVPTVGFGGGHYPIKHTKLHLESEYCYGHIFAKYYFTEDIPVSVYKQAFTKNYPVKPEIGIIEKKSLKSGIRKTLIEYLNEIGVEYRYI